MFSGSVRSYKTPRPEAESESTRQQQRPGKARSGSGVLDRYFHGVTHVDVSISWFPSKSASFSAFTLTSAFTKGRETERDAT
ncbi:hypothetical protein PC111_g9047 [Phytophthora cactorum]|uniref:Uncharacterized protein n=1 Tax=Phytophthora cactorum TaxID=29920 RepID=A0A8T1BU77_9STRA|nr:hypothetical protein PC111_g9047 [Phytophthora cactorum]KAG2910601.1 hypothetical protein PC115_g12853 [Phytophthora cactorum]KAG3074795.1 hypothetical protein PC121_g8256 [Phytophthora cactorum]